MFRKENVLTCNPPRHFATSTNYFVFIKTSIIINEEKCLTCLRSFPPRCNAYNAPLA
ncbi:hypothetical protein HanRHA438_Chr03g0109081 [Helianthus annuus]|nr:hypothetical protein HanIR_Chr03g0106991 [Helianthus annuus]KAJ0934587.1 hypothetical protein HanRHA438_Chr03g0109081 [Helianthus annuus]